MTGLNYINIGETTEFNSGDYPKMVAELAQVVHDLHQTPIYFKKEIFLSFVRDHSIKTEWIAANPALVQMITTGGLVTAQIEEMFEACRWNKPFRLGLERFVKERLN